MRGHPTLIALAAVALSLSCDDGASHPAERDQDPTSAATRQLVLSNLVTAVFVPAAADFAERGAALSTAVRAWAAVDGAAGPELDAAQSAWRDAMASWQYNEVLRAGPAGAERNFLGGLGLRDRIYSWPTSRPCGVDQNIVDERYAEADFFGTQLVNVVGLDALEYLLFHQGADNDCPSQVGIDGTWAGIDGAELARRRAAYAAVLAVQIADDAAALHAAWSADGDDFASRLAAGAAPYADTREALEQIFHGMYYLDQAVKDLKLAVPVALSMECAAATGCPDELESRWAGFSRQNLAANIRAVRDIYEGGPDDAHGFDDLLVEAGAPDLAEQMSALFDAALASFEGDAPTLAALIADDLEAAQALHADVKAITDLLKSRFVVVLDLDVPASSDADND